MADVGGVHVADSVTMETKNRPDEWKIEQGMHGAKLPFLDQTGTTQVEIMPREWPKLWKNEAAIQAVGNRDELFKVEKPGWKGYVLNLSIFRCRDTHCTLGHSTLY